MYNLSVNTFKLGTYMGYLNYFYKLNIKINRTIQFKCIGKS